RHADSIADRVARAPSPAYSLPVQGLRNQGASAQRAVYTLFHIRTYSYRKLSTGSNCAARLAGSVPKIMPTSDDTTIAMIADRPEMGMRYSVKKRTENGIASPIRMRMSPPISEISTASDRN